MIVRNTWYAGDTFEYTRACSRGCGVCGQAAPAIVLLVRQNVRYVECPVRQMLARPQVALIQVRVRVLACKAVTWPFTVCRFGNALSRTHGVRAERCEMATMFNVADR